MTTTRRDFLHTFSLLGGAVAASPATAALARNDALPPFPLGSPASAHLQVWWDAPELRAGSLALAHVDGLDEHIKHRRGIEDRLDTALATLRSLGFAVCVPWLNESYCVLPMPEATRERARAECGPDLDPDTVEQYAYGLHATAVRALHARFGARRCCLGDYSDRHYRDGPYALWVRGDVRLDCVMTHPFLTISPQDVLAALAGASPGIVSAEFDVVREAACRAVLARGRHVAGRLAG